MEPQHLKRALSPDGESHAPHLAKRIKSNQAVVDEAISPQDIAPDLTIAHSLYAVGQCQPLNSVPQPASRVRPARQLMIFGNGEMGQLGLGTTVMHELSSPRTHAWFESAIAGGVLGDEEGAGIEYIAAGGMHTLVIDELGRIWSWGVNDNGALGRPTVGVPDPDAPDQLIDYEVLESQPMLVQKLVIEQFRAVRVAAGDSISVALNEKGQLRAWGSFRASDGLLGFDVSVDEPTPQLEPVALPSLEDERFVQIACGADHVLALTQHGTVFAWGNGQQAQLGRRIIERRKANALAPERLALRRIVYIAVGNYNSFAISETGIVYAWGLNNWRQAGVEPDPEMGGDEDIVWLPTELTALSPESLGGGKRVIEISGGEHHTLFLLNDGSVYGCGRCDGSELGLADDHPAMLKLARELAEVDAASNDSTGIGAIIATPTLIPFPPPPTSADPNPPSLPLDVYQCQPPADPIVHISVGTRHNLAVSQAGHVYAWGLGDVGQLGLGDNVNEQKTPTRVRSQELNQWSTNAGMWTWYVENASAGGQHCALLVIRAG